MIAEEKIQVRMIQYAQWKGFWGLVECDLETSAPGTESIEVPHSHIAGWVPMETTTIGVETGLTASLMEKAGDAIRVEAVFCNVEPRDLHEMATAEIISPGSKVTHVDLEMVVVADQVAQLAGPG